MAMENNDSKEQVVESTEGVFSRLLSEDRQQGQKKLDNDQYEALQKALSESLSSQLAELKEAQTATQGYQQRLSELLESGIMNPTKEQWDEQLAETKTVNSKGLAHFTSELNALMNVVNLQFEEQKQLESAYREQRDSLDKIQQEYQALKMQQDSLEAQCEMVNEDNLQRDDWVRKAEQVLSANSDLNNVMLEDINQIKSHLSDHVAKFNQSEVRLHQLTDNMSSDKEHLRKLQQLTDFIESQMRQVVKQSQAEQGVLKEVEQTQQHIKVLVDNCFKSYEEQQAANARVAIRSAEMQTLYSRMEQLTQQVADQKDTIQGDIHRFQKQLAQFQQERQQLEAELQQQRLHQQKDLKDHDLLIKQKLADVDQKIDHLESLIQESAHVLTLANNARKVANRFNEDVADKLAEINRIHGSIEAIGAKSEAISAEYEIFKKSMQAFSQDLSLSKQEEKQLLEELEEYKHAFKSYHQEGNIFKHWCQDLKAELTELEQELLTEKKASLQCLQQAEAVIEKIHSEKHSVDIQKEVVQKALGHIKNLFQKVNTLVLEHQEGHKNFEQVVQKERELSKNIENQSLCAQDLYDKIAAKIHEFDTLSEKAQETQLEVRTLMNSCQDLADTSKSYAEKNQTQIQQIDQALTKITEFQTNFETISDQFTQMQSVNESLQLQLASEADQLTETEKKVNQSCQVVLSLIEKNKTQTEQLGNNLVGLRTLREQTEVEFSKIKAYSDSIEASSVRNSETEKRMQHIVVLQEQKLESCEASFKEYQQQLEIHEALIAKSTQQTSDIHEKANQVQEWFSNCELFNLDQDKKASDMQAMFESFREEAVWFKKSFAEYADLSEEVLHYHDQSLQLKKEIQQILAVIGETSMSVSEKASHSDVLHEKALALFEKHHVLDQSVTEKMQQLETIQHKCSEVLEQSQALNTESVVNHDQAQKVYVEVEHLSAQVETVLNKVNTTIKENNLLKDELSEGLEHLKQIEFRTQSLVESVQSANQSAQTCITDVYSVKDEAESLLERNQKLITESERQQKIIDASVTSYQTLDEHVTSVCTDVDSQLLALNKIENDHKKALEALEAQHIQQHQLNETQQKALQSTQAEYVKLRLNMEQFLTQWSDSIQKYQELRSECQAGVSKTEEFYTKMTQLVQSGQDTFKKNQVLQERTDKVCDQLENRFNYYEQIADAFMVLQQDCTAHAELMDEQKTSIAVLAEEAKNNLSQQQALYLQCEEMQNSMTDKAQQMIDERVRIEASGEHYLKTMQNYRQQDDRRIERLETQLSSLSTEENKQDFIHEIESLQKKILSVEEIHKNEKEELLQLMDTQRQYSDNIIADNQQLTEKVRQLVTEVSELKQLKHDFQVLKKSPSGFLGQKIKFDYAEKQDVSKSDSEELANSTQTTTLISPPSSPLGESPMVQSVDEAAIQQALTEIKDFPEGPESSALSSIDKVRRGTQLKNLLFSVLLLIGCGEMYDQSIVMDAMELWSF